jgi:hypothetical protein
VLDVHDRHLSVPSLSCGAAFADLLKDRGAASNAVFHANGVAQLRSHPLIGLVDLFLELLDEGLVDSGGHVRPS